MRRILGVLAVVGLLASGGCFSVGGTIQTNAREPYVGIQGDFALMARGTDISFNMHSGHSHHPDALGIALGLTDLPLSFAVDTALLPVTLTRRVLWDHDHYGQRPY